MGSCFCLLLCYVLWKGQINERVGGKYYIMRDLLEGRKSSSSHDKH